MSKRGAQIGSCAVPVTECRVRVSPPQSPPPPDSVLVLGIAQCGAGSGRRGAPAATDDCPVPALRCKVAPLPGPASSRTPPLPEPRARADVVTALTSSSPGRGERQQPDPDPGPDPDPDPRPPTRDLRLCDEFLGVVLGGQAAPACPACHLLQPLVQDSASSKSPPPRGSTQLSTPSDGPGSGRTPPLRDRARSQN